QQRIDHGADVVDHVVVHDLDFAGRLVDLELADVYAVRITRHFAGIDRLFDQARLVAGRQVFRIERRLGDFLDGERLVGFLAGEHAVGEFDVGEVHFKHVGGVPFPFGLDLPRRHGEGRARERRRARAAGAFGEEHLVGVALDVSHLVGVEAEAVTDDLLERGLVALALGDAAGKDRHRAGAVEPDLGAFEAGGGRALDGVGETKTAQLAVLARLGAARLKAALVGGGERHVHVLFELAAVVGEGHAGLVRHGARRNGVAPAQFRRIDAGLAGGKIDTAPADIGPSRPPL